MYGIRTRDLLVCVYVLKQSDHESSRHFTAWKVCGFSPSIPCLGLGAPPAPSSRRSRHAPKCVQMDQSLAQTEFGAAAPPANRCAQVAGGVGLSLCSRGRQRLTRHT